MVEAFLIILLPFGISLFRSIFVLCRNNLLRTWMRKRIKYTWLLWRYIFANNCNFQCGCNWNLATVLGGQHTICFFEHTLNMTKLKKKTFFLKKEEENENGWMVLGFCLRFRSSTITSKLLKLTVYNLFSFIHLITPCFTT